MTYRKPLPHRRLLFPAGHLDRFAIAAEAKAPAPRVAARHWISRIVRSMGARLAEWRQRSAQRRELGDLPVYLLNDIGVSQEQAARESRKHFWVK